MGIEVDGGQRRIARRRRRRPSTDSEAEAWILGREATIQLLVGYDRVQTTIRTFCEG